MPTFRALLPDGLTVTDVTDSGGEFASVVVNDGKGRSLVQINVQHDMRDVAHQLYGDATTLPDGTLLATSKKPGEKGGSGVVMWTADSMRPDGMRVFVSAFNSGEQSSSRHPQGARAHHGPSSSPSSPARSGRGSSSGRGVRAGQGPARPRGQALRARGSRATDVTSRPRTAPPPPP
ncbi:hypothetical protein SBADM41S_10334 [Streptomyces badius]